jgi:hypothetical protein
MNASLKDLIQTGRFGPVQLGMSREQIESSLGAPDELGGASRKYRRASIWKYGDVELHFAPGADNLLLIHLDDFEVPSGGKSVNLDPWIIRRSLTLSEAEEQLSQSGVRYEVRDGESDEQAKCLVAGVGVKLIFVGEAKRLSAVSYFQSAI